MKTNKGFAPILLILILLAVAVGGLYYENNVKNNPSQNKKTQTLPTKTTQDTNNKYVGEGCSIASGCNGPIECVDGKNVKSVNSICIALPEFACYKRPDLNLRCEKQSNGKCGWTQTSVLQACINNAHF